MTQSISDSPVVLPDGRKLYRIDFKVRPSEDHPLHQQSACGILSIWNFETSRDEAIARSLHLFDVLPFIEASGEVQCDENIVPDNEAIRILFEQVELVGFSAYYEAYGKKTAIGDVPFPGEGSGAPPLFKRFLKGQT